MFMLERFLMGSSWNFRYETLRPYIHIHQNREHRIDIQTSSFLQVNNEFLEIQIMGIIQCVIFLKKHQEISLNKEVEDFKGFEDEARNGMNVDAYRLAKLILQICQNDILLRVILIHLPMNLLTKLAKASLKFMWKHKDLNLAKPSSIREGTGACFQH